MVTSVLLWTKIMLPNVLSRTTSTVEVHFKADTFSAVYVRLCSGSPSRFSSLPVSPAGQPSFSGLRGVRAAGRLRHG